MKKPVGIREMTIKVALADDHFIVREGLRASIEKEPDFEFVGEAGNGRMAIEIVRETRDDWPICCTSPAKIR